MTGERRVVYGVSPEFAMTKMDDVQQFECDIYVEDARSAVLLTEILAHHGGTSVSKCRFIPSGAASVLKPLGQMVMEGRFPRPSLVYLDGDQGEAPGCQTLPGQDSPERVVFSDLRKINWGGIDRRVGRDFSDVADACTQGMSFSSVHDWVRHAATTLRLSNETLWTAMCSEWALAFITDHDAKAVIDPVLSSVSAEPSPSISIESGRLFSQP
jgi:hypothetical protein